MTSAWHLTMAVLVGVCITIGAVILSLTMQISHP